MSTPFLSELHDRFSRGEQLSEEEHQILAAWYEEQDHVETTLLRTAHISVVTAQLQQQITQTAHQLEDITQQITATISANNALRVEIGRLQARLAQLTPGRAA
jgi:septal ring factor EnvC (AmiA/AmiB activator)